MIARSAKLQPQPRPSPSCSRSSRSRVLARLHGRRAAGIMNSTPRMVTTGTTTRGCHCRSDSPSHCRAVPRPSSLSVQSRQASSRKCDPGPSGAPRTGRTAGHGGRSGAVCSAPGRGHAPSRAGCPRFPAGFLLFCTSAQKADALRPRYWAPGSAVRHAASRTSSHGHVNDTCASAMPSRPSVRC